MNKKISTFQNIFMLIIAFLVIISLTFLVVITPNDELWNFQNIYKMFNNFTIYTDANVIVTPIFFYLGNILLHFFSSTVLTFRIYNTLIYAGLFFIIYKILKNLKTCKNLNLFYVILTFLLIFQVIANSANYNALAIVFSLIGLNLYISRKSNNLLQGLLIFLIFFTKQNIGIFYALCVLIYELYDQKFTLKYIINQFKKIIFFIIPTLLILLKLHLDGNLFDFINYCFAGLFEFSEKNIYFGTELYYLCIPVITIGLYVFTLLKKNTTFKNFDTDFFKNLTLLFIFALINTLIIYPIVNEAHLIFTFPFHLLFIFYYFDTLIFNDIFKYDEYKTKINWFSIIILLFLFIRTLLYFYSYYDTITYCNNTSSPYFGTFIPNEYVEKISTIKTYILEKNKNNIDVIILSHDSCLTMVELRQNHGFYDLLFNGNLGYNGIENVKNDILSRENTEFLVVTDPDDLFEQEPPEIRQFIIDNLEFKGHICNYSIYEK